MSFAVFQKAIHKMNIFNILDNTALHVSLNQGPHSFFTDFSLKYYFKENTYIHRKIT